MSAPYDIVEVCAVSQGRLWLRFADGTAGEVDVSQSLHGPVFEVARTTEGFEQVSIDPEGRTVRWPGGANLAPDVLHRAVADQNDLASAREALTREMRAQLRRAVAADAA